MDAATAGRFWAKVTKTEQCWLWIGAKTNGYGSLSVGGRIRYAHHVAWELEEGPLPADQYLKRRCAETSCVRPAHLFLSSSNARPARPLSERFWEKVAKTEGCWQWRGQIGRRHGYGVLGVSHSDKILAHRLSFEIHRGAIPKGRCVLHKCDNRRCVRPDHLFLGTRPDNTDDMLRKERHVVPREEWSNGHGKLTASDVRKIRSTFIANDPHRGAKALAQRFGVTPGHVIDVVKGRAQRHVR